MFPPGATVSSQSASGVLAAKHVVAREPRTYQGGPVAGGKVAEVSGSNLVVEYPDGSTLTVTTDASTLFVKRGDASRGAMIGSLSDVTEGARVLVFGIPSSDGKSLAARTILVGQGKPAGGPERP